MFLLWIFISELFAVKSYSIILNLVFFKGSQFGNRTEFGLGERKTQTSCGIADHLVHAKREWLSGGQGKFHTTPNYYMPNSTSLNHCLQTILQPIKILIALLLSLTNIKKKIISFPYNENEKKKKRKALNSMETK